MYTENYPENFLNNNKKSQNVEINLKFIFPTYGYDENITFDYFQIYNECPCVQKYASIENNEIKYELPHWISPNELMEYLYICKNGFGETKNLKSSVIKILQISEFFENFEFCHLFIKESIIKTMNKQTAPILLEMSYEKLNNASENGIDLNPCWFELFYAALENMAKNILFYLNDTNLSILERIKGLNKKIIEELLEKAFSNLILNNFTLNDESEIESRKTTKNNSFTELYDEESNSIKIEDFENLINFLAKIRNSSNVFDLLINEYLQLSSEESIGELESLPNPTFQVSIPIDMNNYYNEFPLDLGMGKTVTFIIYYKKSDDSLNVTFKLTDINNNTLIDKLCFNIFTFMSVVSVDEESISSQTNVRSAGANNKSHYPIFKINNLKQIFSKSYKSLDEDEINNETSVIYDFYKSCHSKTKSENFKNSKNNFNTCNNFDYFKYEPHDPSFISNFTQSPNKKLKDSLILKINFRICFLHTAIASFILKNFRKCYHLPNIHKVSTQFFKILIKNKQLRKDNEDQVVTALLSWRKNIF